MISNDRVVDYSQLFELIDPLANRPLRLEPGSHQTWLTGAYANRLFYGELQPPEPVVLKGYMGGSPTEVLWAGLTPIVCVSQRIVDLLLQNRFTGWATYPVEVYDRKGVYLPGYYGLAVKSHAGEQDFSRSQIVTKPPLTYAGRTYDVYKGTYFDESKWDGSDIFRVQHATKIVTKKVQQVFKRAKITNVRFIPLLETEIDVNTVKIIRGEFD